MRNVLLTLLFVAVAMYAGARFFDLLAVSRLEAKVRKQGHPLTVEELIATRPVLPDDKNGANALLNIWQSEQPDYWDAIRKGLRPELPLVARQYPPELPYLGSRQLRFSPGQQLTPASLEALEGYLRTNSHRLAAIRDALRAVQYQFPIDFEETYSALLPHLPQLKTAAQTFRLEALLAAHSGDVPAALGAIQHVLLVGNTLSEEPLLLSQLVRFACIASALLGAEDLLCRQALSSEQLDALQKLFEPLNGRKMLHLAMLSERVMCLSAYDNAHQFVMDIE